MKILFIADGRSPTALNWISHFVPDHEVHLVSTFPAEPTLAYASFRVLPVAFSAAAGEQKKSSGRSNTIKHLTTPGMRTAVRQWLGALTLPRAARQLTAIIQTIDPDLIHAMRIPYEGMLLAMAKPAAPKVVSIWGNDFTLHAPSTPLMSVRTRQTLRVVDAITADTHKDIRLAHEWGYPKEKPTLVVPGAGGIQLDLFQPPKGGRAPGTENITVINPRGMRAYINNEAFFQAIPLVLAKHPTTKFICPAMQGEPQPEAWVRDLGIAPNVSLLPRVTRPEMAALFQQAEIVASPSLHDGTPNSLLEAMACGCYPIAGDIEALREWIVDGENGRLFDPRSPEALADALIEAIDNPQARASAAVRNRALVEERAEYGAVMARATGFYEGVIKDRWTG